MGPRLAPNPKVLAHKSSFKVRNAFISSYISIQSVHALRQKHSSVGLGPLVRSRLALLDFQVMLFTRNGDSVVVARAGGVLESTLVVWSKMRLSHTIMVPESVPLCIARTWNSGLLVKWSFKKLTMASDSWVFNPLMRCTNAREKNKLFSSVTGCVDTNEC